MGFFEQEVEKLLVAGYDRTGILPAIKILLKFFTELLAALILRVCINVEQRIRLGMAGISLNGFIVAVTQFQLIGSCRVSDAMKFQLRITESLLQMPPIGSQ